jgi:predicted DNA binding CopG/RHH family protein
MAVKTIKKPTVDFSLLKLDPLEQFIEDNFDNLVTTDLSDPLRHPATQYTQTEERKQISFKARVSDVNVLKKQAHIMGMPYQTLLNMIIHQYAEKHAA